MNIFKLSSEIEKLLREVGGTGVGLKELRISLGSTISDDINNKIIRIGSLRNKVAHDGYEPTINELRIYTSDSSEVISALNSIINRDWEHIESFSIELMGKTYLYEYIPREFNANQNYPAYIDLIANIEKILDYYSQQEFAIWIDVDRFYPISEKSGIRVMSFYLSNIPLFELKKIPENLTVIKNEILSCIDDYINSGINKMNCFDSIKDDSFISYEIFMCWFSYNPIGEAASRKIDDLIQKTSLPIRKRILNEGMGF